MSGLMHDLLVSPANTSAFSMLINQMPVRVLKGSLQMKLNHSYVGEFLVHGNNILSLIIGNANNVSLSFYAQERTTYVHAVITSVEAIEVHPDHYKVHVASPLMLMSSCARSRSFSYQSVRSVLSEVLCEQAFGRAQVRFHSLTETGEHDYLEQHQQSDHSFFERVMAEAGWSYYFIFEPEHAIICLDDLSQVSTSEVAVYAYRPGLQTSLCDIKIETLTEWFAMEQGKVVEGVAIVSNIPGLMPGIVFDVVDHPDTLRNQRYRVLESRQYWDETAADQRRYQHHVRAVPVQTLSCPLYAREAYAVSHLSVAHIRAQDMCATLTEQGNYFMQPVDMPILSRDPASVRQLQSFVGDDHGMHFPMLHDAEVLVARVNGHPNYPVILGGVYQPLHHNPVSQANAYQHVMATAAGNRVILDDTPTQASIVLETFDAANRVSLDAATAGASVGLASKGDVNFAALTSSEWKSGRNTVVEADDQVMLSAREATFIAREGELCIAAAGQAQLSARTLRAEIDDKVVLLQGQDFLHTVKGHYSVNVMGSYQALVDDAMLIQSRTGTLGLIAVGGRVVMESGASQLNLDPQGDTSLKATRLTLEATEINMRMPGAVS